MNRSLAQFLSVVFHPLLMPTLFFFVVLFLSPEMATSLTSDSRKMLLGLIFVTTYLIPGCSTYLLYRTGAIGSLTLENRQERKLPLLFTTLFYSLTAWLFYRELRFDELPFQVMMLMSVALLLTFIISFYWKISAHSVGIGGVIGMLMALNGHFGDNSLIYPIVGLVVLGGFVISSRLALQAHLPSETAAGFFMGFAIGLSLFWLI